MNLLAIVAFVAFIIAAVLAFITDTGNNVVLGFVASGLAAWVASGLWPVKARV